MGRTDIVKEINPEVILWGRTGIFGLIQPGKIETLTADTVAIQSSQVEGENTDPPVGEVTAPKEDP